MQFIALTPFAVAELERNGIPHKTAMDYPGREERYNEGLMNYSRINSMTEILDQELYFIHKIPTLRPAQYPFYYLKNLFDVLSSTVLLLETIIHVDNPDTIIYCTPQIFGNRSGLYAFSDDDSVFSEVLPLMAKNSKINFICLKQVKKDQTCHKTSIARKGSLKERVVRWIRDTEYRRPVSFVYNIGLIRKKFGLRSAISSTIRYLVPGQCIPILIYEYGYSWDDMLPQMIQAGFSPIIRLTDHSVDCLTDDKFRGQPELPDNLEVIINDLLIKCGRLNAYTVFGQIDVSPILVPKMAAIISDSIKSSINAYNSFRYLRKTTRIQAVLLSVHTHSKSFAVVQAARDAGAKVISWQHGGAGFTYQPLMPYIELYNSDYHFVYGDGVKKSYQNTLMQSGFHCPLPKIFPVGSASFDMMKRKTQKEIPRKHKIGSVLYVTTNYYRNGYYISQPTYPIEYDINLWIIQRTVLDLARANPNCVFTIKLHPTHCDCQPLKEYASSHGITNVIFVVGERTLIDLVASADMVIFDLISTGILQAMTTNKPIFVFGGLFKIDEPALRELIKRVYYSESIDEFASLVNRCISKTNFPKTCIEKEVDTENQDFLKAFGTQSTDGKSAERALDILKKILNSS